MPTSEDAQASANKLVEAAQEIANSVVDLGEEAAATVLDAVITANRLLGESLVGLRDRLVPH